MPADYISGSPGRGGRVGVYTHGLRAHGRVLCRNPVRIPAI